MKFYHGTTKKYWKEIQKEGVLWGRKNCFWMGNEMSRVTYLARDKKDAGLYNDKGITKRQCVLLEVDIPEIKFWNGWQIRIYEPIPINCVKKNE